MFDFDGGGGWIYELMDIKLRALCVSVRKLKQSFGCRAVAEPNVGQRDSGVSGSFMMIRVPSSSSSFAFTTGTLMRKALTEKFIHKIKQK